MLSGHWEASACPDSVVASTLFSLRSNKHALHLLSSRIGEIGMYFSLIHEAESKPARTSISDRPLSMKVPLTTGDTKLALLLIC